MDKKTEGWRGEMIGTLKEEKQFRRKGTNGIFTSKPKVEIGAS